MKTKTILWIVGITIVIFFIMDFGSFRETDEERNIRWAKKWLEQYYDVIWFDGDVVGGSLNMPIVRMRDKGDRATQVGTGFDALTIAYPKGDLYTLSIVSEIGPDCIYGLTSEEWTAVKLTTYGTIENVSFIECS